MDPAVGIEKLKAILTRRKAAWVFITLRNLNAFKSAGRDRWQDSPGIFDIDYHRQGQREQAEACYYQKSMEIYREAGDRVYEGVLLTNRSAEPSA